MLTIAGGIILAVVLLWSIAAAAQASDGCGLAMVLIIGIPLLLYACS